MARFACSLRIALPSALSFTFVASPAIAISDHLHCYKIKDAATKAEYTADLTHSDLTFPNATGCEIKVPAKLVCVDTEKSNVSPAPPGADDGAEAQKYLCYKAKCPKVQPTATLEDQFGTHAIEVKSTSLLCAPIPAPATCSDAQQNGNETDVDCGGGTCPPCNDGEGCLLASDCISLNCDAAVCTPAAPTCTDLMQNGSESGTDCGGGTCPDCPDGEGCFADSDCISNFCQSGVCSSLLGDGQACSSGGQCTSNNCVDGFCCNTACTGPCFACSAAKSVGMDGACSPIDAGSDPDNECTLQSSSTCGTNGTCNGAGACSLWPAGTVCAAGACMSGTQLNPDTCNGSGTCQDNGTTPCAPYACGSGTCRTSCSNDSECASSAFCSSGACVSKLIDGSACTSSGNCINNNCVDGVCCNSSCAGLCQACTAAKKGTGSDGTCGIIVAGSDPDDECAGTDTCNGMGTCQP